MKNQNNTLSVGDTFPAFVADDIYGTTVDINKYKGKVVLIGIQNVSQHMIRDKEEMGKSQKYNHRFYKEYKKQGLEVISITHKNGIFSLVPTSFMAKKSKEAHIKHNTKELVTILLDSNGSLKKLLKMTDTPLIFLIDKDGIIRYKKNGYLIVDAELEQIIKQLN